MNRSQSRYRIKLDAESDADAAEASALIPDKDKYIVKSIRCNTLSAAIAMDAREEAEEDADADMISEYF